MAAARLSVPAIDQHDRTFPIYFADIARRRQDCDIQVLRGISILMVLFCHLSIGATSLGLLPVPITMPFRLGVDAFFVVSGYVITRSLMKDDFHGARFFVKRLFRLMPALLCFIGLTLVRRATVMSTKSACALGGWVPVAQPTLVAPASRI